MLCCWLLGSDPGGTRTHDPLIKSQLLYQLSYGVMRHFAFAIAKVLLFFELASKNRKKYSLNVIFFVFSVLARAYIFTIYFILFTQAIASVRLLLYLCIII